MNVSLLILVGWLSATLAPLPPGKYPSPEQGPYKPQLDGYQPLKSHGKLPKVTRPAKVNVKPGSYAHESLQLPPVVSMDSYDAWQQGPAWPPVENGVVVVTPSAADPQRFMAFLVDVNNQRIAAIRDGDTGRHFFLIGQMTRNPAEKPGLDPQGSLPPTIQVLAGSGAVIIIRPPVPPGPTGLPDGFTAALLDVATITRRTLDLAQVDLPVHAGHINPAEQLSQDQLIQDQFNQGQLNQLNQGQLNHDQLNHAGKLQPGKMLPKSKGGLH